MTLRITGGQWRNRTIPVPSGFTSRPTTDKVRQALFNILAHAPWAKDFSLQDAVILDAFAGTGAVGLDALSHGASHCLFLDNNKECLNPIQNLAKKWDIEDKVTTRQLDFSQPLPAYPLRQKPNLVFLDPPYNEINLIDQSLQGLLTANWLAETTLIAIEQVSKAPMLDASNFAVLDQRQYGVTRLAFLIRALRPS